MARGFREEVIFTYPQLGMGPAGLGVLALGPGPVGTTV